MELTNICPDVKAQIYKLASINLCSNVDGQIMVAPSLFLCFALVLLLLIAIKLSPFVPCCPIFQTHLSNSSS
jgi:hypothetical protein